MDIRRTLRRLRRNLTNIEQKRLGMNLPRRPPFITIGRHTYGVTDETIYGATATAPVSVGSFCSIAEGVIMLAHVDHPTRFPSTYPFRTLLFRADERNANPALHNFDAVTRGPITVGHDVWMGQRALILSGVTIGSGAVIGAGAVISRDVPPYAIAVGNPSRIVRYRFSEEAIAELLALKWWELEDDIIQSLEPYFYSADIGVFLRELRSARSA